MNNIYVYETLTARLSVATPEITNMRRNEIMISETSARATESAGVVPKKASGVTLNISLSVKLASKDPASCAPIYDGTCPNHCTVILVKNYATYFKKKILTNVGQNLVSETIYRSYLQRVDKLPDTKETIGKWRNRW